MGGRSWQLTYGIRRSHGGMTARVEGVCDGRSSASIMAITTRIRFLMASSSSWARGLLGILATTHISTGRRRRHSGLLILVLLTKRAGCSMEQMITSTALNLTTFSGLLALELI